MELQQFAFWAITGIIGGGLILFLGLIKYNLNKVIQQLEKQNDTIIHTAARLDVVENNYTHLSNNFDKLYDAIKDLTIEMKQLTKEIAKKKDM